MSTGITDAPLADLERASRSLWSPPPTLTVSEWADRERVLSAESSGEQGRWRTARAPFQRGIMDAMSDPHVAEVWVMKSSQVGWTEMLGNVVGYHVHHDPCPMLLVQPTVDMGKAWSKDRLAPMIRDTPALQGKIRDAKSRDSGNTLLSKNFAGGHITIAGANSPAGLASRPIRVVLFDEVDRFPASAGSEGDPINLAKKRATTFWNRKILGGSTPTIAGASRIEMAFNQSDQRYYFVPCPHCGEFDRLRWPNVRWPEGKPRLAVYVCPHCGAEITDADKGPMLARGEWRATQPFKGIAGFHVSELYSPWVPFGDMAEAFLSAKGSPETLQTFINTSLGEVWHVRGEAPPWESVAALRQPYDAGTVPDDALALTCGVDVQKNRFVYAVRAWGRGLSSWLVEEGELYGDTATPEAYELLDGLLAERWGEHAIRVMLIDSGYRAPQVYAFARRHPHVRPTKGHDTLARPFYAARVDVTVGGKLRKGGMHLWHIDSSHWKSWVHGRIEWPPDQAGAWLLHADTSDDYCRQIVAESLVVHASGKTTWIVHGENHWLDAEALNAAAAQMLQIHRMPAETGDDEAPAVRRPPPKRGPPRTVRRLGG